MFTAHNTDGYTQQDLDTLNAEAETRVPDLMARFPAMDQDAAEKAFADEVAAR